MSEMQRNTLEELLHAYVDGQLSPEHQHRFEQTLKNDPVLQEKVETYKQQNRLLHGLFDPVLEEGVPQQLTASPPRRKTNEYLVRLVASVALLCIGGVAGWMVKDSETESLFTTVNLVQTATRAHMVYVPEIKHPVEVLAENEQHLVKWLSKRLGNTINAPDLNKNGFGLVGGRLLPSDSGPAAQFMYENKSGDRLTLFVRSKNDEEQNTAFHYYEEKDTNAFYWIDGKLGYVIVGNISRTQLLDTAHLIYQQLSL